MFQRPQTMSSNTNVSSPLITLHLSATGALCPQVTLDMVTWPPTVVRETAIQPCPCEQSQSTQASRICGTNGEWGQPDTALCDLSVIIENLCPAVSGDLQVAAMRMEFL